MKTLAARARQKQHLNRLFIGMLFHLLAVFNLIYEDLGRFKAWNKMLIYDQSGIPGNIPGDFLLAFLINETSEAADINIVAVSHGILHHAKKSLDRCRNIRFVNSGLFSDFVYYICFSHFVFFLVLKFFREAKFTLP